MLIENMSLCSISGCVGVYENIRATTTSFQKLATSRAATAVTAFTTFARATTFATIFLRKNFLFLEVGYFLAALVLNIL
jgi:hypothetical protein